MMEKSDYKDDMNNETKQNNPMHLNCVQLPASTYYIIYNVGSLGINIYIYARGELCLLAI